MKEDTVIDINIIKEDEEIEEETKKWIRLRWVCQISITLLVIGFSVYNVISSNESFTEKDIFVAIISGLIGLQLPSPKVYK